MNRPIPTDRIKLLIFDLDGTLVDSRQDLANSVNAMLRWLGRPELPCDVIATYIGDGAPMLVRRALGDPEDDALVMEALEYFMTWYREHKLDNTYVYSGTVETLRALRAARNGTLTMAVLSNKPVNPSRAIVEALGLGEFFFQTYGGNSFPSRKPDPTGAFKLLEEAGGVRPDETIMIGDSHNDVLTAKNAGMWSIGLTYGLAPQTLEIYPPDILIDRPDELAAVFGFNVTAHADASAEVPRGEGFTG
ncbi:MAG TPA: HAD-IA family hydrolase [Terriglobales bacterium]|nr:HAD-IA family hydrolase [Terriglobales bacterium]